MAVPNASQSEGLNIESFAIWASASSDITEFVIANSVVLIVAALLLLSCIKHARMCWEVRQDKHRLHCCYIRHCALLHAAKQRKEQHSEPEGGEKENAEADKTAASDSKSSETAKTASSSTGAPAAAPASTSTTTTTTTNVPVSPSEIPSVLEASVSAVARQARNAGVSPAQRQTEMEKLHSCVPSLQLPLTSTSSSDFSFASSSSPKSATSRLLNRLSLSPAQTEVVPATAVNEGSAKLPPNVASAAEVAARRNGWCPRYTEYEQRMIDEKRQANAQAWMEAKRALESTESLTSCVVSPSASTTRRAIVSDNETASREELM